MGGVATPRDNAHVVVGDIITRRGYPHPARLFAIPPVGSHTLLSAAANGEAYYLHSSSSITSSSNQRTSIKLIGRFWYWRGRPLAGQVSHRS